MKVVPTQVGDGSFDRRERGAQIVRNGAQERGAPAVDPAQQLGLHRLLAKASPFDGEGRLIGEGAEAPEIARRDLLAGKDEHADRPTGGGERDAEEMTRLGHHASETAWSASSGEDDAQLVVGHRLAGLCRDGEVVTFG